MDAVDASANPPSSSSPAPARSHSPSGSSTLPRDDMSSPRSTTSPTSTPTHDTLFPHQEPPSPTSTPASPTPRPARTHSTGSFVSSPLNPASPPTSFARDMNKSRPVSRGSTYLPTRFPSDDPHAPVSPFTLSPGSRGSMVLYRLASDSPSRQNSLTPGSLLPPKKFTRDSILSSSGDSIVSFSSDSKYPSGLPTSRGIVPYSYDPALDELEPPDEEDMLHDPDEKGLNARKGTFPWRGLLNIGVLFTLISSLLCLFVFYPVLTFFRNEARNDAINGNININGTGQAPVLFQMPSLIDKDTPDSAKTRTGFDGEEYELVFSDEFEVEGRTFYPGDDPFWEAVDLWYGATGDLEWYDPQQVSTRNGSLVITMDSTSTVQSGLTPGSTAPFTADQNHNLQYRSGMLQSWNKFCFTSGYMEVSVVLPGPGEDTQGYWPGAWTMGNLARPGYPATTDGMWPYSYNDCDVGTFPNQTLRDGSGPAAALHSDASRAKYNFELSWLSGQKLSSCTCPGEDHPGPSVTQGRGAPEIDVFEAEKDKLATTGQVVSQSAQFAPFTHDYLYGNATDDQWKVWDPTISRPNSYRGSAVQQAISGLTRVPPTMFQGSGAQFVNLGFEYWANPSNPDEGFITWQSNGSPTVRMGAPAVGPDQGADGSGVGKRLIPEEAMAIVLNLGISPNWQTIDLTSMIFPAEMLVDYVRIYQRKGQTNIGCDPKDYPTAKYISSHMDSYTNANISSWNYPWPKNGLYQGGC